MFSCCQSHQNIDILVPKNTNKAAKQQSWCQESPHSGKAAQQSSSKATKQHSSKVPSQQLSSQAGAKMAKIS